MKTETLEQPFDIALADKQMNEIQTKAKKLNNSAKDKIQNGILKLLQIILRNVQISKNAEIELRLEEGKLFIGYNYKIGDKQYSYTTVIEFIKKYDITCLSDSEQARVDKKNLKVGDLKKIQFSNIGFDFIKCDEVDVTNSFDYIALQNYLTKELIKGGEFASTMNFIYSELVEIWKEVDGLWNEYHELKNKKSKQVKINYENQIRNSNYFVEGNFIVVRKLEEEFLTASVYEIGKVQKTTFYKRNFSIEIGEVNHSNREKYAIKHDTFRREEKRCSIDTYISIWASELERGNRVEVLNTKEWNELKEKMDKEYSDIEKGKLNELSERYRKVLFKKYER